MKNMESGPRDQETGTEEAQKRIYWKEIYGAVDEVKDALENPIDEGIKETVVAFNVNGFPTNSSCEGHVEERFGKMIKLSPHLWVEHPEPQFRFQGEKEIREKIAQEFNVELTKMWKNEEAQKAYWDYIRQHEVKETPEYIANREANQKLKESFLKLLDEFYQERKVQGKKLNARDVGANGAFYVSTATNSEEQYRELKDDEIEFARQELSQEQREVADFTVFLKEKYFDE